MVETSKPLSATGRLVTGLLCIAFGSVLMLATFNAGLLDQSDINGPYWLGLASGITFAAAGLAVIAGPERPLLNSQLVILTLCGLAALGNWVAFGVGARTCNGTIVFWANDFIDLSCRLPFAFGAVVINSIIALMTVITVQKALGGPPQLARLRRTSENLLLLSLAPILLPMVLILFLKIGYDVVKVRLTTRKWPRNEGFIERQKLRGHLRKDVDVSGDT